MGPPPHRLLPENLLNSTYYFFTNNIRVILIHISLLQSARLLYYNAFSFHADFHAVMLRCSSPVGLSMKTDNVTNMLKNVKYLLACLPANLLNIRDHKHLLSAG